MEMNNSNIKQESSNGGFENPCLEQTINDSNKQLEKQVKIENNTTETNKVQQVVENADEMNQQTETIGGCAMSLNAITSTGLVLITGYITYLCVGNGIVLFSFHPILMATGYLILMFQAILSMSDLNCWTVKLQYKQRVTLHWVLQTTALILITTAFVIIYLNKIKLGKEHFHTWHAIFGLITFISTILVSCGGIWTKYSFSLRQYLKPVLSKVIHSFMGVLTFCLAVVTISFGIYSSWFTRVSSESIQFPIVVFLILSTIYVIYKPIVLCLKRITSSFRASL